MRTDVPYSQIALFLLHLRKTRQTRFKFLQPSQVLRQHLPAHGAPHSSTCDPHLIVLCVVSRGYDPCTLEWRPPSGSHEVPHEISAWTDEYCMLIIKYFCPAFDKLVTLGCYYTHVHEPIEVMHSDGWLEERLKPFIERREVAPLQPDLVCWEEYCYKNPKDVLERNIHATIEKEGLYSGDILIWQPAPSALSGISTAATIDETIEKGVIDDDGNGVMCKNGVSSTGKRQSRCEDNDAELRVLTVKDLATRIASQVRVLVRLHSAVAPWCPDGILADGAWGQPLPGFGVLPEEVAEPQPMGPATQSGTTISGVLPGELGAREVSADARWRVSVFANRVVKAFGLESAVADDQAFWLFDRGPPAALDEAPVLEAEAIFSRRRDRLLSELLPRSAAGAQQRWVLHAVLLPRPPVCLGGRRPVALHFFNSSVCEVGACILHVSGCDVENLPKEDDQGSRAGENGPDVPITGRPTIDPLEVLELARQYLDHPARAELRSKLAPRDMLDEKLPLRLLDVVRGRIRAVSRSGNSNEPDNCAHDVMTAKDCCREVWPARGANFLAAALRVEVDWEPGAEEIRRPFLRQGSAQERMSDEVADTALPGTHGAQLVEVFHAESSGHAFGHPFLLSVFNGERASSIAKRLQTKLDVPDIELRQWRLVFVDDEMIRETLDEADEWPIGKRAHMDNVQEGDSTNAPAFCIERLHPAHRGVSPSVTRAMRAQKPLTIRVSPTRACSSPGA